MDGRGENAYSSQATHVRFDMNGINPLVIDIGIEEHCQFICETIKDNRIQRFFSNDLTHIPQCLIAHVLRGIRFISNIKGIVPLYIESQLVHSFIVGQVMRLLKE